MTNRYLVSRSRFIAAAPEAIFEVLATPALHSVIDGSGTVKGAQPRGPERLALGAKFGMEMNIKHGLQDPQHGLRVRGGPADRLAALRRPRLALPAGTLPPTPPEPRAPWSPSNGTRGKCAARILLRLAGYLRRHPANIEQTLAKLDAYMTSEAAAGSGHRPGQPSTRPAG